MKNYKKKRIAFVGSIFAISIAALVLVILNFRENIVFFYSPTELKNLQSENKKLPKKIRIGGLVKEKSVKKITALEVEFVVTDLQNEVKTHYSGLLPDLFREKQGVVANGFFDKEKNEFFSSELLIKHDEKYVPPEISKIIKGKN